MTLRSLGRLFFYIGILLSLTVLLAWLVTRDWENLLPTWWQVAILLISLVLVSIKNLLPALSQIRNNRAKNRNLPLLLNKTVDDLLFPLGRGGRVNYIFRQIVDSNDLMNHRRLVITGETGCGKSRTAIELIRRLILEEIISPQGVFVPDPAFQYLERAEIKTAVAKVQASQSIQLLFIDNLPGQVSDQFLDQLSELLSACEPALVVTTARTEDLWEPVQKWLTKETFTEIRLHELNPVQVRRLIDLAGGVYGLQLNDTACGILAEHLQPIPGRLLVALQRIANRGKGYVTPDQVLPHTLGSLADSLFAERARLVDLHPGSLYLLEALATIRACHLQPDSFCVLKLAEMLHEKAHPPKRKIPFSRQRSFSDNATILLQDLDVNLKSGVYEAPQLVLDNLTNPETAHNNLETCLLKRRSFIPDGILRRVDPYACRQAWNLFVLGCAAFARNDSNQAIQLLSKAIRLDPHPWFFTHRCAVYASQKDIKAAVQDANKAIQLDPKSARAYTIRADFYLLKNEFKQAVEDYAKAIELDPKDPQAWLNRGNAYFAQEDIDKALADFDTALQLAPGLPAAVMARAKAHNLRGNLDQAIADYNEALALNPEDTQLIYSRAMAYDSIKDYPRAIAEYDKLIALNPKDSQAFYNRGKAYHMLGKLDQAVLDYEQAILANPRSAIAYRNRANALIRLNRLMEAKSDCREAERLEPNHPYTHARWGQYFAAREDYIGAIEKYQLATRLIGDPTHFNLDIALCLLSSGNSAEGLAKIKERLKKGARQEEIQEALRDFQAQYDKHPMAGMKEAIHLLKEASARLS